MKDLLTFFRAISDQTRLRILLLLLDHELCVCELMGALRMAQPRISRALAVLRAARVLNDRRAGKWVYYGIRTDPGAPYIQTVLNHLKNWLKNDSQFLEDRESLEECFTLQERTGRCDLALFAPRIPKKSRAVRVKPRGRGR